MVPCWAAGGRVPASMPGRTEPAVSDPDPTNPPPRPIRHRRLAAVAVVVTCVASCVVGYFAAPPRGLSIDTDTTHLLADDLPFRQSMAALREAFPDSEQPLLVVIEAPTPEQANTAADRLARRLMQMPELIEHVQRPYGGDFFDRYGLLYRSPEELEQLSNQLTRSKFLIDQVVADPTLSGYFGALEVTAHGSEQARARIDPFLGRTADVVSAQLRGEPGGLSWQREFSGQGGEAAWAREVLYVRPEQDFKKVLAAKPAVEAIRAAGHELGFDEAHGPRLRVTGKAALANEEIATVARGMAWGGPTALALVLLVVLVGMRSLRLGLAMLLTLLVGLALTAGWAAVAVGRLNLISIAFAMLYVGLGVDFAIHFSIKFRTFRLRGANRWDANRQAIRTAAEPLMVCAVTTALGFFAFVPTPFAGVGELGIIAGGGMVISLIVTLTLLPAILLWIGGGKTGEWLNRPPRWMQAVMRAPTTHRRSVLAATAVLLIAGAAVAWRVDFDSDPLNLRDQSGEAVASLRELQHTNAADFWTATVLADSPEEAQRLADALARLPEVKRTMTIADFVPRQQAAKLETLRALSRRLGVGWSATQPEDHPDVEAAVASAASLRRALAGRDDHAAELASALRDWVARVRGAEPAEARRLVERLQDRLIGTLPATLAKLETAIAADSIDGPDALPQWLRDEWIGPGGRYRVEAFPATDLRNEDQREAYVDAVLRVAPAATGPPVLTVMAGREVVHAFRLAMLYAVAGITVILLLQLRSVLLTGVVLLPLATAGVLTAALMVLFDWPFNFANVIALPLLLGIGVDSGIHMVHRARRHGRAAVRESLLETTTARGVLLSTLTTLASFGSLAFSPHPGTASMGQVLSVGLILILIATLVLLPALLGQTGGTEATPETQSHGEDREEPPMNTDEHR